MPQDISPTGGSPKDALSYLRDEDGFNKVCVGSVGETDTNPLLFGTVGWIPGTVKDVGTDTGFIALEESTTIIVEDNNP
jgi:hypothetical protein|nr:MAG TPA: hypothetical protein [Caudoviricetes sp.]